MKINFDKVKKFKQIPKKVVLAGSLAAMLLNPLTAVKTNAYESNNTGYYELSDDEDYLYVNGKIDFSIIDKLDDLKELYICNTNIDNNTLSNNTNITKLVFEDCKFTSNNINLPSNLKEINFIDCNINSLSSFNKNSSLKKITFENISFNNLKFISDWNNITSLELYDCNIMSLDGIENLKNLKVLYFDNVGIENISNLKYLTNLKELTLDNTYVSDLSAIKDLKLYYLDVCDSVNIKNLDVVTNIDTLNTLLAYNCEMSYTKELVNFVKVNNIDSNVSEEGLEIKNKVKQIANNIIKDNMSDFEKIEIIVNYVIDNMTYDYEAEFNDDLCFEYNDYALKYALQGTGCCKNYTTFLTSLFNLASIKTYEVRGSNHIWNLVKVGNDFYWIDSTWIEFENLKDLDESKNYMIDVSNDSFISTHTVNILPCNFYFIYENTI